MKVGSQMKQMGRLNKSLREKRAKLYIIRRCVVMLLRWSDWSIDLPFYMADPLIDLPLFQSVVIPSGFWIFFGPAILVGLSIPASWLLFYMHLFKYVMFPW